MHTLFQAFILLFQLLRGFWFRWGSRSWLFSHILQVDIARDPVEVKGGVTGVSRGDFRDLPGDPVDGFVSEFLGTGATAAGEDFDEPGANPFVFSSGLLRVRAKPGEKLVEGFLV